MRSSADALSTLSTFSVSAVAAIVGIAIGYGIATLQIDDPRHTSTGSSSLDPVASSAPEGLHSGEFIALQRELEDERRVRENLARELEALREQMEPDPRGTSPTGPEVLGRALDRPRPDPVVSGQVGTAVTAGALAKPRQEQPWFDRASLENADYSSSEIDEIVERFEAFEMQKLYLEDESRRDGTFRTAGYNGRLLNLGRELREDLGAGGYDAYLYATGRNNRVEVREVLTDSPASYAGLEQGDIVISYSGNRVFHPREFKNATATGEPGARVTLEVQRDGELYRLSVARGPLGIRMGQVKKLPLPRW